MKNKINSQDIAKRTDKLMKQRNVRCNLGGCNNHSGHEYCSVDAAYDRYWDEAKEQLETELYG